MPSTEERLTKLEEMQTTLLTLLADNEKLRAENAQLRAEKAASRSFEPTRFSRDTPPPAATASRSAGSRSDEFTRSKRSTLHVPEGREQEALAIPGVGSGPSAFGGTYFYMEPNHDLLKVKEFWTANIELEYDQRRGVETFTRSSWTRLDISPEDTERWEKAKKIPRVIEINGEDGLHLSVPKNTNLMSTRDYWSTETRDDYIAKDDPTEIREKWSRLHVSPDDTQNWKRAKTIPGVREFEDETGTKVLGIPDGKDLTPAKKAELYFSRDEWTTLDVSPADWEKVKAIHGVRQYRKPDGPKLGIPPKENLLATQDYWPEKAWADHAVRHDEKFVRGAWTVLDVKPGTDAWSAARYLPNVVGFGPGKSKLGIPKNKDLLPCKKYWPRGVTSEYEKHQTNVLAAQRARAERAAAMR